MAHTPNPGARPAPISRAEAYRKAVSRNQLALWRYGYLRRSGVVQPSLATSFADRDGVVTTSVASLFNGKHAVAAVRKISIEGTKRTEAAEQQLSQSRSTFEQVKATSTETLPVLIRMTTEPYKGLPARTFSVRLGIITGDKPALVLRIVKLETHVEEMAEELASLVRSSLGDDVPVLLGEYSAKA